MERKPLNENGKIKTESGLLRPNSSRMVMVMVIKQQFALTN
jgi:hypothetical protein